MRIGVSLEIVVRLFLSDVYKRQGMHFENELPGYALDLATSIELVHWDTTRYMSVSYTHLDVYKRQPQRRTCGKRNE